ncbi:MAG TPA: D-Ala-D-Ala carboxypeptidase family metallohydrolase [Burkholderiaceae bacterium]|nr:D-Ala-D-Ala carboxypeptidase family metallohydrolase [Burkholderiaceae bacterium]
MQLSNFFTLAEMTRSETAARENIANQPGDGEVAQLRALCGSVLDPLRAALGRPIKVNSGYRSPALNRRIGGAANSQHVEGKAVDIQSPGISVLELFKSVIRGGLPFDQLIYEAQSATAKWVHLSHNEGANRGEIRVAEFGPDGKPRRYPQITIEQALAMSEPATRGARGAEEFEYLEIGDEPEEAAAEVAPAAFPSIETEMAPESAEAERPLAERPAPEKAVPEIVAPERPAAKGPRAKKAAPTKAAPTKAAPKEIAPMEIAPKEAAAEKAAAKKVAAKKVVAKKVAAKKPVAKKAAGKKAAGRQAAQKKTPAKKAPAKKGPLTKEPPKKSPPKKARAKKTPAKKSARRR